MDEETTATELLRDMLWSRTRATRILRWHHTGTFGQYAAVAAIIDDHDRRNPQAPAAGPERVLAVIAHTRRLQDEIREHPEKFTAAAGLEARRTGAPDPALLLHAGRVLVWLPTIVVPDELDD